MKFDWKRFLIANQVTATILGAGIPALLLFGITQIFGIEDVSEKLGLILGGAILFVVNALIAAFLELTICLPIPFIKIPLWLAGLAIIIWGLFV
ncbi:MAG TPA: hypothetical protein PK692_08165 [Bacteroidales bacterium]|nr:hypothetical protein [Bacteroidales bacterium]HQO08015.1 hypothetical protein [Bacteroidales bacterium]HQP52513.1 hypothetical protein [Bacteroidales bacterium]